MEYGNILKVSQEEVKRTVEDTQGLQRRETEDYLRALCVDRYPERRDALWKRDYSSEAAFLASVEPNRARWREALGVFEPEAELAAAEEPFLEDGHVTARFLTVPFAKDLNCRAVLALPRHADGRRPLVVAQHGISSSPENVFGLLDAGALYHAYGYRLARDGFAVLAPLNITTTARARYCRLATLLGKTLAGLETSKIGRLIDYAATLPEIDPERIGMWGISLGGYYTLFTLPVEPRIRAGVCTAFFNSRVKKMVVDDPRHSCFLSTEEEHIFIPGWLREFADADLVSLICPRHFMVQTGKADAVSWWPWVVREFETAREHYRRLGCEDRIVLDLHSGGHEIRYEEGRDFLARALRG